MGYVFKTTYETVFVVHMLTINSVPTWKVYYHNIILVRATQTAKWFVTKISVMVTIFMRFHRRIFVQSADNHSALTVIFTVMRHCTTARDARASYINLTNIELLQH